MIIAMLIDQREARQHAEQAVRQHHERDDQRRARSTSAIEPALIASWPSSAVTLRCSITVSGAGSAPARSMTASSFAGLRR